MPEVATLPPRRRPELIIRPTGDAGMYVVKDPVKRSYYQVGEQEAFLLERLDGARTVDLICDEFSQKFGETLSPADVSDFVELARDQNFLEQKGSSSKTPPPLHSKVRSILYWRKRVLDPDNILNWLEPRLRWIFTGAFLFVTLCLIATALCVSVTHGAEFIRFIPRTWETLVLIWITVACVTA